MPVFCPGAPLRSAESVQLRWELLLRTAAGMGWELCNADEGGGGGEGGRAPRFCFKHRYTQDVCWHTPVHAVLNQEAEAASCAPSR